MALNNEQLSKTRIWTKIDFNEINILELAKNLATSQYSINMSINHAFR